MIRRWLARRERKQTRFSFVPAWVRATFQPVTFRRLVEEGYRVNSAVFACVSTLAFSFPEPPLQVGREEDGRFVALRQHPLRQLLRRPNPDMGEAELMQILVVYASIGGNAYLWKQRSPSGKVVALWPFSDAQITPVPGRNTAEGLVAYYEYDAGDGRKVRIPKEDIIHWKWMPDPLQPWRGMGAIQAAAREVDRDNEAARYIYALLKNDAVPKVVVTLTEDDELTEEKAYRLRRQWTAKLGGENRGGVAFLEYGMKVEKLGFDLNQLAAEALSAVPEARIAAAFRVPPVVAGLSVGLKRSDYGDQAARRSFAEQTLTALWRSLSSELERGLQEEFGDEDLVLRFDLGQVMALRDEAHKIWERATNAFDRGMITRAEAKRIVGLEPKPGDDIYKLTLAADFTTAPAQEREKGAKGMLLEGESKVSALGSRWALRLRRMRMRLVKRMTPEVERFFAALAEEVVERLTAKGTQRKAEGEAWETVDVETVLQQILRPDDFEPLEELIRRYGLVVMEMSLEMILAEIAGEAERVLGETVGEAERAGREVMARMLEETTATQVREIKETTRKAIRDLLAEAQRDGWSVDDLVRGRDGRPGLRDLVAETYQGRAETIARTELGRLQNQFTLEMHRTLGVEKVVVMDNGQEDPDPACAEANGQIWSLSYADTHLLEHPRCTRAFGAYFGPQEPDRR